MQLIVDGKFEPDQWQTITELGSPPQTPGVVAYSSEVAGMLDKVPGAACLENLGVSISPELDDKTLRGLASRVGLLAIDFPDRLDGRGFSVAVMCRRWGFSGELRAVGAFIPDQYPHLDACGFDSIGVPESTVDKHTELEWRKAFLRFPLRYQSQQSAEQSILQRRLAKTAANNRAFASPGG